MTVIIFSNQWGMLHQMKFYHHHEGLGKWEGLGKHFD